MPVYLVPSSYQSTPKVGHSFSPQVSSGIVQLDKTDSREAVLPEVLRGGEVKVTSMGALLPDSFGPGSEEMMRDTEEGSPVML